MRDYHSRQTGLIDPVKLTFDIGIIGGGSIGSWTSLGLLKLGCKNITVYDFDNVEEQNIGPQLYSPSNIGEDKVDALKSNLIFLTDEIINTSKNRIDENTKWDKPHDIYISALDTIKAREDLFNSIQGQEGWFVDGRMEANEIQVFVVDLKDTKTIEKYRKTLFKEESAEPIACSMRSVVYNCLFISGLITDIIAHIANEEAVPFNIEADLKNFELYGGLISNS